jgi:DNA-directed RNA polymerase specialized sigma24 family protein
MLLEWARTVARNVGTDYLRRRREEWDQREFVAEIEAVVDSDEWEREIDDDGQSIMLRLLAAAHAAEPADVQTVLWHHLVEGDEWSATGDAMGIAHTAAKRRFQRAQKRLRHAVLKRLIDLPPDELRAVRRWLEHIDLAVSPFIRTGPGDA